MNTKARTFNEVVSDWEHGLEPYTSVNPSSDTHNGFSEMIASAAVRLGRLLGLADFFSLKVRSSFLTKVIAAAVFWFFFAVLPPLNTGPEDPRGYYVHNFLTDTVEYKLAERNIVK